jgi:RNA polymerase sigma-70 factor (ECF subfamily)
MLDSEENIIKNAVRGDTHAFGLLYDHYQPAIYRFVVVKVGRREDAEDITHQVFVSAWQNMKQYRHRGHPFSSWLYRIARNQVIDHYRARKDIVSLEVIEIDQLGISFSSSQSDLSLKLDLEKVMSAIRNLKQEYQDVVILRFIEELSLKETARAMKKTEGAVKLMQHRAIGELKKMLGEKDSN